MRNRYVKGVKFFPLRKTTGTTDNCRNINEYCVIEPSLIRKMKRPKFDRDSRSDYSKKGYRTFLESMQPLFKEFEEDKCIYEIGKQLQTDAIYERDDNLNFRSAFLCAGDSVKVRKHTDGTYSVLSNGMHRAYIAKKYGLRLLVNVKEEEIADPDSHT